MTDARIELELDRRARLAPCRRQSLAVARIDGFIGRAVDEQRRRQRRAGEGDGLHVGIVRGPEELDQLARCPWHQIAGTPKAHPPLPRHTILAPAPPITPS